MIEIVREFVVKEEAGGQFELAFGPGGAWSKLFARCPGFRGATLLRDEKNPRRYLVFEVWETEAHRERALADAKAGYAELQTDFAVWCESITGVGAFRMLAEAAVRPRGGSGRGSTGRGYRRRRRAGR